MNKKDWASLIDEYVANCKKNISQHPDRTEHFIEVDPHFILWAARHIGRLEYMQDLNRAKITAQANTLDQLRDAMRASCRDDRSEQLGGCPLLACETEA